MHIRRNRTTKYSSRERYSSNYSDDDYDSEDDGYEIRRRSVSGPRQSAPTGAEIVVAPKPAPPEGCKYKCCPCHAEKAAKEAACHCLAQAAGHLGCPPPPPAAKPEEPRIVINVVDKTNGHMAQHHGREFHISIKPNALISDIIAALTPDPHRHKVVVRWNDGFMDDLEAAHKVEELNYSAKRLYIVNRKQVRYA